MHLIFFDVETTGAFLDKNAMVELGAVCINAETSEVLGTFHQFLQIPEGRGWEARCLREFWEKNDYMRARKEVVLENGRNPEDVMNEFVLWCHNMNSNPKLGDDELRFAGDAIYYDCDWVSHYLSQYTTTPSLEMLFTDNENVPQFRPVFHITDYYKGLRCSSPKEWSSYKKILQDYDISEDDIINKHDHSSLHDSLHMAEVFSKIWNRQEEMVSLTIGRRHYCATISTVVNTLITTCLASLAVLVPVFINRYINAF